MRFALVVLSALILCGCAEKRLDELGYQERKELADQIVAKCRKLTDGSDAQIKQCGMAEVDAERARRIRSEKTRAAFADALEAGSAGFRAQPSYVPPATTTCTRVGGFVQCNSY